MAGAPIKPRTSSGVWRMANWTESIPKVVVLLAGTNNVADLSAPGDARTRADDIARGLQAIVHVIQEKAPAATIIVMGIFPRNDNMAFLPVIASINRSLSQFADGPKIRFLNINDKLADAQWAALRRDDEPKRQTPSHRKGISSLGRRSETDPYGVAGATRRHGSRPTANRRPLCRTLTGSGGEALTPLAHSIRFWLEWGYFDRPQLLSSRPEQTIAKRWSAKWRDLLSQSTRNVWDTQLHFALWTGDAAACIP